MKNEVKSPLKKSPTFIGLKIFAKGTKKPKANSLLIVALEPPTIAEAIPHTIPEMIIKVHEK